VALGQLFERRPLESDCDLYARRAQLDCGPFQQARARILCPVDAMAEAHDPLAAVEPLLDPTLGVTRLCDLVEHRNDVRGRPAMQRPRERADRRGQRRPAVGPG
jgi:hypothetical protein